MKHLLLVLVLAFSLLGISTAQDSEKTKIANATLERMRQLDLLNQLIPLVMTKEQIRKLLPAIEKARRDVKIQQAEEADLIGREAARVQKAVEDGINKGDVPDVKLLRDLNALIRFMSMKRDAVASDNTKDVMTAMKATLNAGQLKAAGNSLNPRVYETKVKPEEMKDDDRLELFVREIMLDPLAYDILVKMQAGARG